MQKNIPSAAGLGGGSSNAAAALIAGNALWGLNWPLARLSEIAGELGSDIPFFLTGGTAVCTGRGEDVQLLEVPAGYPLVIAAPPVALSTREVFSKVSISDNQRSAKEITQSVCQGRLSSIGTSMFNRLQEFAEPLTNQISRLAKSFADLGSCLGHQLSGSGSSYFGVFANLRSARLAASRLSARHPEVRIFMSQTLSPFHFDAVQFSSIRNG